MILLKFNTSQKRHFIGCTGYNLSLLLHQGVILSNGQDVKVWRFKANRMIHTEISKGSAKPNQKWHSIDWKEAEVKLRELQEKIVIATLANNIKEVYKLQWKIVQSLEGQALAVRKVVTNKGGKTPGVDKVIWKGPADYWNAIIELTGICKDPSQYEAQPLRRKYIPKGNSNKLRPLGIPTLRDRTIQALYSFCLDPVVETRSDPNSYGFRKYRSTYDAITAIRSR